MTSHRTSTRVHGWVVLWAVLAFALSSAPALLAQDVAAEDLDLAADAEALERKANDRFASGDYDGAINLYRRLADMVPTPDEKARVMIFQAYLEHLADRDVAAVLTMTEALRVRPDHPFRAELYTEAFAQLFFQAHERARLVLEHEANDHIEDGLGRLRGGDFEGARSGLRAALALRPNDPTILFNIATVDFEQGRLDDALGGYEKVLTLVHHPDVEVPSEIHAKALVQSGYLYQQQDQLEAAETALAEATRIAPEDPSAWTNLGVVRRSLGQRDRATEAFRRAHALQPDDPKAVANLALGLLDARDWRAAATLLEPVVRRHTDDPRLRLNLGLAQRGLGDRAGAMASFEAVVALDVGNAAGLAATAATYAARLAYESQSYNRALELAGRALESRPDVLDAWIVQALAQLAVGRPAEAKESLLAALRLDPSRATVHENLGAIHYQLGELDAAEAAFQRALEIRPDLASARSNLEAVRLARSGGGRVGDETAEPPTTPTPPPERPSPAKRLTSGLRYADIDYSELGLSGAMIAAVEPGSPADLAGIQANDLALKVDGQPIESGADLELYLDQAGDQVTIDLLRASRPLKVVMRVR